MKFNPYKRVQEIDAELEVLEIKEKEYGRKSWKNKPSKLQDIETSIMFLCFEKLPIEKTIKYFEAKIKRDALHENTDELPVTHCPLDADHKNTGVKK